MAFMRLVPVFLFILFWVPLSLGAQQRPGAGGQGAGGQGGFGGPGGGQGGLVGTAPAPSQGRTITVGGRTAPVRKIVHGIPVAGTLERVLVRPGDRVRSGQALLRISRDAVGETFLPVLLESRLDGTVSEVLPTPGEEVKAGAAAVTVIEDTSLVLKVNLSDRDVRAVQSLGPLEVLGKTPEGRSFPGRIQSVGVEPDYATGLFTLTMEFPGRSGLGAGTVLFVDIPVEKPSGILVRRSAVLQEGGGSFLWTLDSQGRLEKRPVTLGPVQDDQVAVSAGLAPGDRFVTRLTGREKPGLSVRELLQANSAAPAAGGRN